MTAWGNDRWRRERKEVAGAFEAAILIWGFIQAGLKRRGEPCGIA